MVKFGLVDFDRIPTQSVQSVNGLVCEVESLDEDWIAAVAENLSYIIHYTYIEYRLNCNFRVHYKV